MCDDSPPCVDILLLWLWPFISLAALVRTILPPRIIGDNCVCLMIVFDHHPRHSVLLSPTYLDRAPSGFGSGEPGYLILCILPSFSMIKIIIKITLTMIS